MDNYEDAFTYEYLIIYILKIKGDTLYSYSLHKIQYFLHW